MGHLEHILQFLSGFSAQSGYKPVQLGYAGAPLRRRGLQSRKVCTCVHDGRDCGGGGSMNRLAETPTLKALLKHQLVIIACRLTTNSCSPWELVKDE